MCIRDRLCADPGLPRPSDGRGARDVGRPAHAEARKAHRHHATCGAAPHAPYGEIMKRISFNRRTARLAGAAALVLAAAASMVAGREKPAPEVVQVTARPIRPGAAASPDIDLTKLERAALAAPGNDPFAPKSFAPPPAPAPVARASAPPQPP